MERRGNFMVQDTTSFGELIQRLRREKGWNVKEFIGKLGKIGKQGELSPAYITKIEVYGEIPNPEVICKMATVLKYDTRKLLECAKQHKKRTFSDTLERKYDKAYELYRTQRKK